MESLLSLNPIKIFDQLITEEVKHKVQEQK